MYTQMSVTERPKTKFIINLSMLTLPILVTLKHPRSYIEIFPTRAAE